MKGGLALKKHDMRPTQSDDDHTHNDLPTNHWLTTLQKPFPIWISSEVGSGSRPTYPSIWTHNKYV